MLYLQVDQNIEENFPEATSNHTSSLTSKMSDLGFDLYRDVTTLNSNEDFAQLERHAENKSAATTATTTTM
jgi:hypothetical protein